MHQSLVRGAARAAAVIAACVATTSAPAQVGPLESFEAAVAVDSGFVVNTTDERGAIFSTVVQVPGAAWLRFPFDAAVLGAAPEGGRPTVLRLTSILDGAVQHLDIERLAQWQHSTAYFNGHLVQIEIVADPGADPSRVAITRADAGVLVATEIDSICGPTDDRELSDDPRAARVVPIGCSVWLIDDYNHCFLTAGHCTGGGFEIVEFNVPLSSSSGAYQHPGPEDQYPIDPVSLQSNGGQGIGNDWAYFGCFPNSETRRTAYETQGASYVLAPQAPGGSGQPIRITGYGTTSSPVPPQWNGVQKTHVGPYAGLNGTAVTYTTDTTGGNSGSVVLDETTGLAIGIHTHAGCNSGGGANNGTAIQHPGLQAALANPRGVCVPALPVGFEYPEGLPSLLAPPGAVIRVQAVPQNDGAPAPGTGMLHYDTGDGLVSVAMVEVSENLYDAVFPSLPCGATVAYSFSVESTGGEVVNDPRGAPSDHYEALAATAVDTAFSEDFESGVGWSVVNEDLDDGAWERGIPAGAGDRGDPTEDFDGSGQCYLTDNVAGNSDVDGGPTRLTSARYDLAGMPDPYVRYARWLTNDDDDDDALVVEVSSDNGGTWVEVESVTGNVLWETATHRVAAYVTPSQNVRFRFSVSDNPNDSVTEAAVDALEIFTVSCGDVAGDVDGDGDVDFDDLLDVLVMWGPCAPTCPADLDGDGEVGLSDLLEVLANWT